MQNKYPLWKNISLIIIVVIGLLYSLPNLYSEDPVLQISSTANESVDVSLPKVKKILDENKIHYKSIGHQEGIVEVRFKSTDIQLIAKDKVKSYLGEPYIVALNLLPSTPNWLLAIGAKPMKQGLDLRGGVHFLLEVDIDSVINRRYEGLIKNLGQELREVGIRYSGIRYLNKKGIDIRFKSKTDFINAALELKNRFADL